jgi:hypothetical protein
MPAVISVHPAKLERDIKTEVVFEKLFESSDNSALRRYFEFETHRAYSIDTPYDAYLENKVRLLSKKLIADIKTTSSASTIISNPNFQSIVKMGESVIPHILSQINSQPSVLVWVLNSILKTKISDKPLSVFEASEQWVRWGRKNNLL